MAAANTNGSARTGPDSAAWRALGRRALGVTQSLGADWADVRVGRVDVEDIGVRNGAVARMDRREQAGFGVRVLVDGCHGFASGFDMTPEEVERVARLAVRVARAGRRAGPGRLRWADEPAWRDVWTSTYLIDPFGVPLERKLDVLMRSDAVLRDHPAVTATGTAPCGQRRSATASTQERCS